MQLVINTFGASLHRKGELFQINFLKELRHRRPGQEPMFDEAIVRVDKAIVDITKLDGTLDERRQNLMGLEGSAAAAYWRTLGPLPPKEFQFETRSRHPSLDPANAMINYAYGVLYSNVERACVIAGLDPFVGFLHTDNYNKKSLVFDMIEPFRIYADRVAITLFTGRRCKNEMFRKESSGAIVLEKEAKELLLTKLNDYLDEKIKYQVKSSETGKTRQIKRFDAIQSEAHSLSNRILGKDKTDDLPNVIDAKELLEESSC